MKIRDIYPGRFGRKLLLSATAATLVLAAGSAAYFLPRPATPELIAEMLPSEDTVTIDGLTLPRVLSEADEALYRRIFAFEERGQWAQSDLLASRLSSKQLLAHVLAERYLSPGYDSSFDQLVAWLRAYPALPQADRIYELALNKNPGASLPSVDHSASLGGFGDDNGLRRQASPQSWRAGLSAWEAQRYAEAAKQFTLAYASDATASGWEKSAAAWWASRAFSAAGDKTQAAKYLDLAAAHPRTFYGIIALRQQGRSLALATERPPVDDVTLAALVKKPAIQRAIALSQLGKTELADMEFRQLFPDLPESQRPALLTLASALDLPSVQITIARHLARDDDTTSYDFALYPRPGWIPHSGFRLNPALIYAFARQESGFRISAQSGGGAMGLMQLMPHTAALVNRRTKLIPAPDARGRFYEPALNLSLGQSYLSQLMEIDRIGDNLLLLAAAYNAGPAKAMRWQSEMSYSSDPLLFVERIPYAETRHYVMQVMANYWIYSALEGTPTDSALALAQDRWPVYADAALQTAEAQPVSGSRF